jgi:hypothetical protein
MKYVFRIILIHVEQYDFFFSIKQMYSQQYFIISGDLSYKIIKIYCNNI